jgi:hypothetical protein
MYDHRLRNGRFSLLLTLIAGSFALAGNSLCAEEERPRTGEAPCNCVRGCDLLPPDAPTAVCGFATVGRLPVKGLISSLSTMASGAV